MGIRHAAQLGVVRLVRRVVNQRHVHHDVDEQRLGPDE
jgi:hypothetical protein